MKRAIPVLLAVFMLATATVSADQTSWRVLMKADNGAGGYAGPGAYVGVYPTSLEGLDAEDHPPYSGFFVDTPGNQVHLVTLVPGDGVTSHNIKAPTLPVPEKTWDLYVGANVDYQFPTIGLRAYAVTARQTPTFDGIPVSYYVRMADNKGVTGAPANGTMWELPMPTTNGQFWTSPVNLPVIKLSAGSNAALLAEGYKLQFVQKAVPEPSGLLALGGCLVGLASFFRRRK